MTEVPVIRLDDLTDEQRKAYMLAHNKLTMNSGFDIDILNEELASIADFDMVDFGFDIGIDDGTDGSQQTLQTGGELDTEEFSDEKFDCVCPKCGFRFNKEK